MNTSKEEKTQEDITDISDTNSNQTHGKSEEKPETMSEMEIATDAQKKAEEPDKKYNELNDKYLRLYSDFDNFRKRNAKEKVELIKYAGEEVIKKLLPVLDDFERAEKSSGPSEESKAITEGFVLIFQKMKNILCAQGLKEMEVKDGAFNSDLHEAITKIAVQDEKQKGKIIDIIEKGYYLNDKVIRHAKVVVGE